MAAGLLHQSTTAASGPTLGYANFLRQRTAESIREPCPLRLWDTGQSIGGKIIARDSEAGSAEASVKRPWRRQLSAHGSGSDIPGLSDYTVTIIRNQRTALGRSGRRRVDFEVDLHL